MLKNPSYTIVYLLYFCDLLMENSGQRARLPWANFQISGDGVPACLIQATCLFVLFLFWMMASMYFPVQICLIKKIIVSTMQCS